LIRFLFSYSKKKLVGNFKFHRYIVDLNEQENLKEENSKRIEAERQISLKAQRMREDLLKDTNIPVVNTCISKYSLEQETDFYRTRYANKLVNDPKNMPPVVFDFCYIRDSKKLLMVNAIKLQMLNVIERNFKSENPFKLNFSNYKKKSYFHENLVSEQGDDVLKKNLIFENEKSYLGIFPQNKLMYLTNEAKSTMHEYDPSKIYIIGTMLNDGKKTYKYASYAQSQKNGIKCQRLPLEKYFK
jgi:hypothetical protein